MPKTTHSPDYTNRKPMSLKGFLADKEKEVAKISRRLDKTYKHPGDFTDSVAIMLKQFGLTGAESNELENKVSVIIEGKRNGKWLEGFFKGEQKECSIFDWLGCYDPKGKRIVLYLCAIDDCARKLVGAIKTRSASASATTLFYMVFLHELGHALHHSMLDFNSHSTLGESAECEKLAQHFTMTCIIAYGNQAKDIFEELEKNQPQQYRTWPELGDCTWKNCRSRFENNKEVVAWKEIVKKTNKNDKQTLIDLLDI